MMTKHCFPLLVAGWGCSGLCEPGFGVTEESDAQLFYSQNEVARVQTESHLTSKIKLQISASHRVPRAWGGGGKGLHWCMYMYTWTNARH